MRTADGLPPATAEEIEAATYEHAQWFVDHMAFNSLYYILDMCRNVIIEPVAPEGNFDVSRPVATNAWKYASGEGETWAAVEADVLNEWNTNPTVANHTGTLHYHPQVWAGAQARHLETPPKYEGRMEVRLGTVRLEVPDSATNYTYRATLYSYAQELTPTWGGDVEFSGMGTDYGSLDMFNTQMNVQTVTAAKAFTVMYPTNQFFTPEWPTGAAPSLATGDGLVRGARGLDGSPVADADFEVWVLEFAYHTNGFQYVSDTVYTNIFPEP